MAGSFMVSNWGLGALKGVITIWLVIISIWDRRERRVPNWLVLPGMFAALLWQLYITLTGAARTSAMSAGSLGFALIAWVVLFMMWRAHFFGGGDAKLLMALFALFPTVQFLLLFCAVVLVVTIPLVIIKVVRSGESMSLEQVRRRLSQGQLLPTQEDLRTQGRPHCWSLALPGVIYLWLVW